MDIRRDWSEDEDDLVKWLSPRQLPAAIVLTKADKLSRGAMIDRVREIGKQSGMKRVIATSSLQRTGFSDAENFMYNEWIKVPE